MTNSDTHPVESELPAKQPWATPRLTVLDADAAEAGPNPIAPEGAFAQGS